MKFVSARDIAVTAITIDLSWSKFLTRRIRVRTRKGTNSCFTSPLFHTLVMPFVHAEGPATFTFVSIRK